MSFSSTMRLRIESDGTSPSTRVVDVETGRLLPVQAVAWSMDMRGDHAGTATATIVVPLVQIAADAVAAQAAVEGALYFVAPAVQGPGAPDRA